MKFAKKSRLAMSCAPWVVTLRPMGCQGSKEVVNDEERLSFLSKVLELSNSNSNSNGSNSNSNSNIRRLFVVDFESISSRFSVTNRILSISIHDSDSADSASSPRSSSSNDCHGSGPFGPFEILFVVFSCCSESHSAHFAVQKSEESYG